MVAVLPAPLLDPHRMETVWVRGPEAIRFLQDLIAQDLERVAPGEVTRSLWLGPQGKLVEIPWVLRGDDEVGFVVDAGRGDGLAASLRRYRIRVKADIEEGDPGVVILEGGSVAKGGWANGDRIEADISLPGVRRTFVSGPAPDLDEAPPELADGLRIAAGEPRMGVDVDESTIPQESGLVESAVALDKGCFLGQELVARINSRGGRVPRILRGLRLKPGVGAGDELRREDRVVGTVSSIGEHRQLGLVGLALVRREVEPGTSVMAAAGEIGVEALPMTGHTEGA